MVYTTAYSVRRYSDTGSARTRGVRGAGEEEGLGVRPELGSDLREGRGRCAGRVANECGLQNGVLSLRFLDRV